MERWEKGLRVPAESFLLAISSGENIDIDWVKNGDVKAVLHPKGAAPQSSASQKAQLGDMSPSSERSKRQPVDFIDSQKKDLGDASPILEMQKELIRINRENSDLLRQNGDLRVENERLRMDLERRDMRIRDLERELAELREARKGAAASGTGVAGSAG